MDEDEILDALHENPLPPKAGQRVAVQLVEILPNLSSTELEIVDRYRAGRSTADLLQKLWDIGDRSKPNALEDARRRLCICVLAETTPLDDQLGEAIYGWAETAGVDLERINPLFEAEILVSKPT